MRKVKMITHQIARALNITGPLNIQFIAKDNNVKVIECNLRASRSFPFVSKVLKINFIDLATRLMLGEKVPKIGKSSFDLDYVGVKASHFSFTRLKGSDPVLGVEMSSTGEVACLGDDFNEAFLKSVLSTNFQPPERGVLLSTGTLKEKAVLMEEVRRLHERGLKLYGTPSTADFYNENGIPVERVERTWDAESEGNFSLVTSGAVDLVINIPKNNIKEMLDNDYLIRRKAVDLNIPLITNVQIAQRYIKALHKYSLEDLSVKSWEEYE